MKKSALYTSVGLFLSLSACGSDSPTATHSPADVRLETGVMFGSGNRSDGGLTEPTAEAVIAADSGTAAIAGGVMFGSGN
jgi:hypothetical protein